MAIVRGAKSDTSAASVTSDYGSGCDVTCDSKSRRVNHDHGALDDITSARTSVSHVVPAPTTINILVEVHGFCLCATSA